MIKYACEMCRGFSHSYDEAPGAYFDSPDARNTHVYWIHGPAMADFLSHPVGEYVGADHPGAGGEGDASE